jgi:hypothetical protein
MLSNRIFDASSWLVPPSLQVLTSRFTPRSTSQETIEASDHASSLEVNRSVEEIQLPKTSGAETRQRMAKTKTKFLLAQPPPMTRSKKTLKLPLRTLLQLQRMSDNSRPLPAFDVVPSSALASRLMRKVPRLTKGDKSLTSEDLVVVRSEQYDQDFGAASDSAEDSEDEATRRPNVVGTIRQTRYTTDTAPDQDEIHLANGLVWRVTTLKDGVYEFSGKEHDSLKLRWVRRRTRPTKAKQKSITDPVVNTEHNRLTFSIIDPNTRRHPVIATLTKNRSLEIMDQIPLSPSFAGVSPRPSLAQSPFSTALSSEVSYFDLPVDSEPAFSETDEDLKILIVLTAVWVSFKEGWSPSFSSTSGMASRLRQDSNNGTPSTIASSSDSIIERRSMYKAMPFRLNRSSTSPVSQRTPLRPSRSPGRAKSAGPSSTRRGTLSAARKRQDDVPPRPPASLSSADKLKFSQGTVGIKNHQRAWSWISFNGRETIDRPKASETDAPSLPQTFQPATTSTRNGSVADHDSIDLDGSDLEFSKMGRKHRPKKWATLRGAYKTLIGPCMRRP